MQKKFVAACCAAAAALSAFGAMPAAVPAFAAGMRGDADGDGRIGLSDVKLLRDFLVGGGSLGGDADMNQDGKLNAKDLTLLKRKAMGLGGGSSAGLVINEVCSTNKTSLKAADGTSPDWIELFNGGDTAVDLSGIGVSDGAVNKYKFTFASGTTLAAGGYLIIFCDDRDAGAPEYHAAFKISASGETIRLTAADGTEIENLALNGNNYISEEELTESTFVRKLHEVTITDSDGKEEKMTNVELISLRKDGGKTWFVIREIPASVLKERKTQADIQYIAMMADIDLEEA